MAAFPVSMKLPPTRAADDGFIPDDGFISDDGFIPDAPPQQKPGALQQISQFGEEHPYLRAGAALLMPGAGALMPETSSQVGLGAAKGLARDAYDLATSKLAGPIGMGLGYLGEKTGITKKVQDWTEPQNPAQSVGGWGATAAEAAIPLPKAIGLLPNAERAGQNFERVHAVMKGKPVNIDAAAGPALRAEEIARATGDWRPPILKKALKALSPGAEPPTFRQATDMATSAGKLSAQETMRMKGPMGAQVKTLAGALRNADQAAADANGVGELYRSAVNEYRRAMKMKGMQETAEDIAAKVAKHWVAGAGLGAGGAAGYAAYQALK